MSEISNRLRAEVSAFYERSIEDITNHRDSFVARDDYRWKAADEIERLERENSHSLGIAVAQQQRADWLEAQCAAMRAALEYARPLVGKWCHYQGDSTTFHQGTLAPINAALSPDAGARVLRVVEAARKLSASCDSGERYEDGRQRGVRMPEKEPTEELRQAIAALDGGKP